MVQRAARSLQSCSSLTDGNRTQHTTWSSRCRTEPHAHDAFVRIQSRSAPDGNLWVLPSNDSFLNMLSASRWRRAASPEIKTTCCHQIQFLRLNERKHLPSTRKAERLICFHPNRSSALSVSFTLLQYFHFMPLYSTYYYSSSSQRERQYFYSTTLTWPEISL